MRRFWCFLVVLKLSLGAGAAEHEPWKLKGAQERIEKYRMGECSLEVRLPNGSALPAGTRIELEQTRHAFHFGGSLAQTRLLYREEWYPAYKERFANLFNYATIGFFWGSHERKPGTWKLRDYAQESMDWAGEQGMTVRGHPLMWHNTAPPWIADTERDVKDLDRDIMEHVRMLVETYPQVDQWDLYNETPGIRLRDPEFGVRRWVESHGGPGPVTEYLVDAVRAIRPDGYYILNHFAHADPEYHEQIGYLLKNKVPFDAIGVQMHLQQKVNLITEEQMVDLLKQYEKYKKPIQFTELTIVSCEHLEDWKEMQPWEASIKAAARAKQPLPIKESTPEMERYQAEFARDFYTLAFSHPSVEAIIWWTVSDKDPWRGMPAGLLDVDGNPKPAYKVLDQLINEEWRTKTLANVNRKGLVPMKGFYGSYEVRVKYKGKTLAGSFDLERGKTGLLKVVLNEL